jgi:hypothetical protein
MMDSVYNIEEPRIVLNQAFQVKGYFCRIDDGRADA